MKILALKMRRLGDTVLWTSAIDAMSQIPGAEVHLAFPKTYLPLFENDARVIKWPLNPKPGYHEWRELRRIKFDAILNFHASSRTALFCNLLKGQRRLIHYHDRNRRNRSSKDIPERGVPLSAIERDLNVVRALGWNGSSPHTKLILNEEGRLKGKSILEKEGILSPPLILSPFASRPSKVWPLTRYFELARKITQRIPVALVFENPRVWERCSDLRQEFEKVATLILTPRLEDLLAVVSQGKALVGSDSGVKHIACALNVPTLTLFGPESIGEWHGYDSSHHPTIQIPVACRNRDPDPPLFSWCGEEHCPLPNHDCMNLITVEKVIQKTQALLGSTAEG